LFDLAFAFLFVPALLVVKLPFPRRFKAWLVALVSLTAVALVSIAPMMRPRAQAQPTTYTITDLGTFSGGTESKAFAINSCGQIAGYATLAGGSKRPFFRASNILIDLGVLSGDGTATSVNNSGYVVGYSPTGGSTYRAFIWHDDNFNNANDPGEMKQLLPDGAVGSAEDINDNGKVVGWIDSAGGDGGTGGYAGFTWENNNFETIAPGVSIKPFGINNAGTIVGVNSDTVRAFVLQSGVFTTIGSNRSVAYAVSEANPVHVVGTVGLGSSDFPTHAFIWTDAGLKDLGTLSGLTNSDAYNVAIVNGSEVRVVGTSYSNVTLSDARAFVWQDENNNGASDPGEMKDLNTLISDASWTVLQQARSINSSGQIVGFGLKTNGETHAFLLTPTGVTPPACATPTPTPAISIILEQGAENTSTPMAAAVDSVTCVRGPFRVMSENNFSGDQTTRVILLTSNLGNTDPIAVTVLVNGTPLVVEAVGTFTGIPNFEGSYIVVSLGNLGLATGDLLLTVSVGTATSNVAILRIH
jgi:probable HAF family extracellular repeat protein